MLNFQYIFFASILMELLDSNWEYNVIYNCLYQRNIQLDKLDRSKVYELAKYDLTKLFEIYDQIDIKSKLLGKLNFEELKSRTINKLEDLKIEFKIEELENEFKIYLPIENLSINIKKKYYEDNINEETLELSTIYVYSMKWNNEDNVKTDYIKIAKYKNKLSFVIKEMYKSQIFEYFDISEADLEEIYFFRNYWNNIIKSLKQRK